MTGEGFDTDFTLRQRAALGAGEGICRALNAERTFMCELDAGHDGDHEGFELPTVTLDEACRCAGGPHGGVTCEACR